MCPMIRDEREVPFTILGKVESACWQLELVLGSTPIKSVWLISILFSLFCAVSFFLQQNIGEGWNYHCHCVLLLLYCLETFRAMVEKVSEMILTSTRDKCLQTCSPSVKWAQVGFKAKQTCKNHSKRVNVPLTISIRWCEPCLTKTRSQKTCDQELLL